MTPLQRAADAAQSAILNPTLRANIFIECDDPSRVYRAIAKAVLISIREPSEEMVKAGEAWQLHCSDVDSLFSEMIKVAIYGE